MKIGELEGGRLYAIRRGAYGGVMKGRLLRVEKIEVIVHSEGVFRGRPVERSMARVKKLSGYYSTARGVPKTGVDDEMWVPARDFFSTWADFDKGVKARHEHEERRKAAERATQDRYDGLRKRAIDLGCAPAMIERSEHWRRETHVLVSLDGLQLLVEAGEHPAEAIE